MQGARFQDAFERDQFGEASGCECAATKTENEDFIAFCVVFDEPLISEADVVIEPLAEDAAHEPVDADGVVDELRPAILAFRGGTHE